MFYTFLHLKKGLTLLEILVSCVLLALVLAGLANVFVVGKRYTLHTRSRIQGAELGRLFIDPLQMQARQDQWGNNCLGAGINCSAQVWTIGAITYTANFTWTSVVPGIAGNTMRKVTTRITWSEPG